MRAIGPRSQSPPSTPAAFPLGANRLLARLSLLNEIEQITLWAARQFDSGAFFGGILKRLNIGYSCADSEMVHIPRQGPVIVVANHPYGLADGLIVGDLVSKVRQDVKFLANAVLAPGDGSGDRIIPVDPFGGAGSVRANIQSIRRCVKWLQNGGILVVFPAGEVSAFHWSGLRVAEASWNDAVVRLVRLTRASTVPIFIHGANSLLFHFAGLVHPRLRTVLLPRELLNKQGKTVSVNVGSPIPANALLRHETDRGAVDYLRWRTELLATRRRDNTTPSIPLPLVSRSRKNSPTEIAPPEDPLVCRREVKDLPPEQCLVTQGDYAVHVARAEQIPRVLREIGRLRETSFRQAGEGTGGSADVDLFDGHYQHLFVWNRERSEIVGGYRLAATDEVVPRYGPQGLYSSTLFRFKQNFLTMIDPALELGRSFVRPEYQKSFAPLLLLWKGIGHYVALRPWYRVLFGPVSISNLYKPVSRGLMVSFLKTRHLHAGLAASVSPRHRYRTRRLHLEAESVEDLSEAVADLEPDHKGVPVLLRQYLNIGGQILDFNVDGQFSNVLDGLLVVDLAKTDARTLDRYLGKTGADRFRRYHGVGCEA